MVQIGIKAFFKGFFGQNNRPVEKPETPPMEREAEENLGFGDDLYYQEQPEEWQAEVIAADEAKWLAALDLNLDDIDNSLDRVKDALGWDYLANLFEHSPYIEAQKEVLAKGDLDADERLSAETCGWAVDALIYKTRSHVSGLLSEAAKKCLMNDFMISSPLMNIFDHSREGYTSATENFNRAVETGSSDEILCSFHSLFLHAESYEFEQMEEEEISWEKISGTIAELYGEDFGSGYADYKEQVAKSAQSTPNSAPVNAPESFQSRTAPMLPDQPDAPSLPKIREAPMFSQADAVPSQSDSHSRSGRITL